MTSTENETSKGLVNGMWKLLMIKGAFMLIIGLILLIFPKGTITTLLFIMAIYWLVDGVVTIYNSLQSRQIYIRWKWGIFTGTLSIVAGLIVLIKPLSSAILTTSFLMWFLGIVAVISGVSGLITGIQLQKQHPKERSMIWGGIFSIVLGLILMSAPFSSALVIIKTIGLVALLAGLITVLFALQVKKKTEQLDA